MYAYTPKETLYGLIVLFINTSILWLCITKLESGISKEDMIYWFGLLYGIVGIVYQITFNIFQIKHNMLMKE